MREDVQARPADSASRSANHAPLRYRWLLFDADGTLFDYDLAERNALERAMARIGADFKPVHLETYRRINHSLWQALERGEVQPGVLKVRRFELLLEELGISGSAGDISEHYLDCLGNCGELLPGALDVLRRLKQLYSVGIVTNGLQKVQRARFMHSPLQPLVDHLIISEEIAAAKPAREFFDKTFDRLGNPARHEVLMIGDNWSSDIQGAADYALDTCWFNPKGVSRPASPPITREIRSLNELIPWLAESESEGSARV
jgi:YjjG family noncanonical pyrimidine nucleotidase